GYEQRGEYGQQQSGSPLGTGEGRWQSAQHFALQGSRGHRDLHSFPTRRSSDLAPPSAIPRLEVLVRDPGSEHGPRLRVHIDRLRSEEHTSELQSRSDLVCRLLLEKKKCLLRPSNGTPLRTRR